MRSTDGSRFRRVVRACTAVCVTSLLASACGGGGGGGDDDDPPAMTSPIEHVVVVMMENRSFDHFLGWLPNADGRQAGLTYTDEAGVMASTMPLAPDYMGCGHPDPDHSWEGGRVQYNGGAMDGFLRAGMNDQYAIGYYVEADRPFFNTLAREYTVADRWFSSILGPTYPNRIFQHAAQTDRIDNTLDISDLPTIWDRLEDAGVSAKYYYSDVPFLLLWGTKYDDITFTYGEFLADAASGNLPAVSFVEPRFVSDAAGTSGSDHPHGDIRVGDAFLSDTFRAVSEAPTWPSTVMVITYDEWGGFFDHVPPPRAAAPNDVDPDVVDGKALLGLRIPVVIASPFSRGNAASPRVVHDVFDHTSVLKLIETNWGLEPLTARDASADVADLMVALDLTAPNTAVPPLPDPAEPAIMECADQSTPIDDLPLEAILQLLPPVPLPQVTPLE
jgi:phospholipase C